MASACIGESSDVRREEMLVPEEMLNCQHLSTQVVLGEGRLPSFRFELEAIASRLESIASRLEAMEEVGGHRYQVGSHR